MLVSKECFERGCSCYDDRVDKDPVEVVKWVGLAFDELPDHEFGDRDFILGARWAEVKLKEKNHG